MSRVAKNPVEIPSGVDVTINGQDVTIKGSKGSLQRNFHEAVKIVKEDNVVRIEMNESFDGASAQGGTARAHINNMVHGVSQGFQKELTLIGVGYRAQMKGTVLSLTLGKSHTDEFKVPEGITIETPSLTEVIVKGVSKDLVGQTAANIRELRPPEPYKGKGIRYKNEQVHLKETKK